MARNFTSAGGKYGEAGSVAAAAFPLTLACWCRPASLTGAQRGLISLNTNGSNNNRVFLSIEATENIGAGVRTTAASIGLSTGTVAANTWAHAAAVHASSTSRTAFLNGVAGTTETTSRSPTWPDRTTIGRLSQTGFEMDGDIAEAAVWSAALTTAEIVELAAGVSPLKIRRASLAFYAPLIGRNTVEIDLVGARGLTLTGSPGQAEHVRRNSAA